ncbi:uncharacterized protein N7459_006136 [Penicillium hispanicum]|uniref:uncharacterized protein n=1 Tax=Penicillium hispanicum TaxID=1080232 RepID=UPI00253FA163|nr:uncharacterized protein N7459_006136 [Penicillium hispanicum]KAJ5580151.1 hypothetical protein N7459_006136 [Penicillium hispanicum]
MKTSISSDVWEKKKALIAKLYMEEEWPLKQVIKQIRSDDFNPSETQLRSRLKKWRVTKPSRQTRKKPQGSEDADSERDVTGSSSTSPRNHRPSPAVKESSTTHPDWSGAHPVYAPPELQSQADHQHHTKWNAPLGAQQLTPSPSGEHGFVSDRVPSFADPSPVTTSFEQPARTSSVNEGPVLNTTSAMTPTYVTYPLSPDSCILSPGSTATPALAQWPPRSFSADLGLNPALHPGQWYNVPFEPVTPPPGVPHSAPLAPPAGYRDQMPVVVPPVPGVFSPEFAQYIGEATEYHDYDLKPSKRAMSLQYDFTGFHGPGRPDQTDRKNAPVHGLSPPAMMSLPTYHFNGTHTGMCAPIAPYMSHEPILQKHPSVGY